MANLTKTVEIVFGGKNEVSKVIGSIEKGMADLERSVDKVAKPLANIGEAIVKIDAALAAFALGGLAYAYNKSVQFDTAMVGLKKVTDGSAEAMEAGRKNAMELSAQYGVSATEILNSTTNFVQAGYNTREAMMLTKAAMDLKIAGDIGAAESSELLIATLKGFDAPASDATRLIDVLNEVSNKYATDVRQLGIGMSVLAPIAKLMGFSFEETAGLLTPVIEVFRSGNEAAIAMKTGLLKLIDDAKPVGEALDTLGVSQKDVNGNLRSGKDILFDVSKEFKRLDQNQKLFLTSQLVGIEQSARMVKVFDNLGKVTEITDVGLKSAGSAAKEVAARLESAEVQINRFRTGFENLGKAIGDNFRVSATSAVAGGTEIMASLEKLLSEGAFDAIFSSMNRFGDRLYGYLHDLSMNMPNAFAGVDFSGLLEALRQFGEAFADLLNEGTKVEGLRHGIQLVVDSGSSLVSVTQGLAEVFAPIGSAIVKIVEGFNSLDASTKELTGNVLGASVAYKLFGPVVGSVLFLIGEDAELMSRIVNGSFAAVENGINAVKLAVLALAMGFSEASAGVARFLAKIPGYDAAEDLSRTSERVKVIGRMLESAKDDLARSSVKVAEAFQGTGDAADGAKKRIENYQRVIDAIPSAKTTEVSVVKAEESVKKATDVRKAVESIPEKVIQTVSVGVDGERVQTVKGFLKKEFPDGQVLFTNLDIQIDPESSTEAGKMLEKLAPDKKTTKVSLETTRLKEQADTVQKSVEWKAKLDIENVQANAKIAEAAIGSIGTGIKSSGDLMGKLLEDFLKAPGLDKSMIREQIEAESRRRDEAFLQQKEIVELQRRTMEAKVKALEKGDPVIQVQAAGLQPHLEMILWELLAAIQVRVNQDAGAFLLGIE